MLGALAVPTTLPSLLMNISLNWLSTHLDLAGKSIREIDDLLTFAGVEVEGIVPKGVSSEKIVVAQIKEAVQHPNADRLKVTQVDAGEGTLRQIVCGAQNYKVGDKVPCALPGAELPGGFTINETVMRKVESKGMLCAAAEIVALSNYAFLIPLDEVIETMKAVGDEIHHTLRCTNLGGLSVTNAAKKIERNLEAVPTTFYKSC